MSAVDVMLLLLTIRVADTLQPRFEVGSISPYIMRSQRNLPNRPIKHSIDMYILSKINLAKLNFSQLNFCRVIVV